MPLKQEVINNLDIGSWVTVTALAPCGHGHVLYYFSYFLGSKQKVCKDLCQPYFSLNILNTLLYVNCQYLKRDLFKQKFLGWTKLLEKFALLLGSSTSINTQVLWFEFFFVCLLICWVFFISLLVFVLLVFLKLQLNVIWKDQRSQSSNVFCMCLFPECFCLSLIFFL